MTDLPTMLGPMAQPSPARLDCAVVNTPDGNVYVLAMVATVLGRQGVWLDADGADKWAEALTGAARQARGKPGLTIAQAMPTGPTSPLIPPNGIPR